MGLRNNVRLVREPRPGDVRGERARVAVRVRRARPHRLHVAQHHREGTRTQTSHAQEEDRVGYHRFVGEFYWDFFVSGGLNACTYYRD